MYISCPSLKCTCNLSAVFCDWGGVTSSILPFTKHKWFAFCFVSLFICSSFYWFFTRSVSLRTEKVGKGDLPSPIPPFSDGEPCTVFADLKFLSVLLFDLLYSFVCFHLFSSAAECFIEWQWNTSYLSFLSFCHC